MSGEQQCSDWNQAKAETHPVLSSHLEPQTPTEQKCKQSFCTLNENDAEAAFVDVTEDDVEGAALSQGQGHIVRTFNTNAGMILNRVLGFCCRGEPLTDKGKRWQLVKVLSLTLLPILGLWVFTVYSLNDSIEGKFDIEQTQSAVKFSVEIGIFLDRIQRERDMSVLYLSILGPETKTFLLNEYILTNEALERLSGWPESNDFNTVFRSKKLFRDYLNDHRNKLDPNDFNIYATMDFYNGLIERFVEWMYGAIKESSMASIWKVLVAYQKIVTGMEHIGIERALGTVFYVEGGLHQSWYERYNNRVNIYKANYRSAVLYSSIVDSMFKQGMISTTGDQLTFVIEMFRYDIQHSKNVEASITKGQWWFDNMTMYLDRLLLIQQKLATFINGELQNIIDEEEKNLTISACFLVFVIFMCPLVIYSVEALTSDIQKYAIAMKDKTKELVREKEKIDTLLYQMVPATVADRLKQNKEVNAEYFKSVTVLFFDIDDFTTISKDCSPLEIVSLLNTLYTEIDAELDNHDVYKVEAINDSYMVASGLPTRNGQRHSAAVANLALTLVDMTNNVFTAGQQHRIRLRIGVDTGPCMAGTVGMMLPHYTLFGDTINTASRMKSNSLPNKIHLSNNTASSLKKHGVFELKYRGTMEIKGKGKMRTFWLVGQVDNLASRQVSQDTMISDAGQQCFPENTWTKKFYIHEVVKNRYSVTSDTTMDEMMGSRFGTPTDEPASRKG